MDSEQYDTLRGRLQALLIELEDRLMPMTVGVVDEFIDVGEFGLALETMAEMLCEGGSSVSEDERLRMIELAESMAMDERVPEHLARCPTRR